MTFQEFNQTLIAFNAGEVQFNHGQTIDAFLYNGKWYPVRAFVSHLHPEINNHAAIKIIVSVIPCIRIKQDVDFQNANGFAIPITNAERIEEQQFLLQRMSDLLYS